MKRKRQYQYITWSFQVKSPSGLHKCQCADSNNTDKFLNHEARYKSIAVHFP